EHLGTRKRREAVLQRYVVVPFGHDRDARRAAADRDLAVPAGEVAPDPGETLPPPRIAKPADPLDQGRLQRRCVAPAGPEALALRRLERMTEPHPGVRHRDHYHAPRQLAAPVVRLYRHPAARAGVFYNILTGLRKRHSETHRRLRIERQLRRQNGGRTLLDVRH